MRNFTSFAKSQFEQLVSDYEQRFADMQRHSEYTDSVISVLK